METKETFTEYDEKQKQRAQRILANFEKLKSHRTNFENYWQDCMDFIVPRKRDVTNYRSPGDKRNNDLFDTTAIMANQLLSGALHGMITNPSVKFFDLVIDDPMLMQEDDVRGWLQESGDKIYNVLNNTNFQTEIHEVYIDLGAIGTSCLFMAEDENNFVHFSARPMKEIYIDENNLGLIDTVFRIFKWKARQIVQEFGEANCPDFIVKAYKQGSEEEYEIVHGVYPEYEDDTKKKVWPFKSCYVLKEKCVILHEGGFKEFPYAVPRWTKTSGEMYGRGPGMEMLPDIQMVNSMMETTLKGAQMTVNPPLMVADDSVIGKLRLTPGGATVVRPGAFQETPIKPLITDARIDFGYQAVEDVRKRIRAGFYVDQLQLNEGPAMTATEVMQRTEEKLRLMGPVLGRQHFEFLRPVIERVFAIMYRRGKIPRAPQALQGKNFDVRYSSLIARAQRMNEGQNFARGLEAVAPMVNAKPEVLDNLNADLVFKHIMVDTYGNPSTFINTKKVVDEIRQGRMEAQQRMVEQEEEKHQAETVGREVPAMAQMAQAMKG